MSHLIIGTSLKTSLSIGGAVMKGFDPLYAAEIGFAIGVAVTLLFNYLIHRHTSTHSKSAEVTENKERDESIDDDCK